jgi:hypothetical protein
MFLLYNLPFYTHLDAHFVENAILIMTSYLELAFDLLNNKTTESNVYSIFSDIARFHEVCPLSIEIMCELQQNTALHYITKLD